MKLKLAFVFLLFFVSTLVTKAQNDTSKWAFGVSAASALYFEQDKKAIGGTFINQTPRLTISRYLFNNLTMVGSYSTSALDTKNITIRWLFEIRFWRFLR
jgi:hypothetical protein